jgi:transcriptional regulator with XRE-family HTH domain
MKITKGHIRFRRVVEREGKARIVAEKLQMSEATVSRIQKGDRTPSRELATVIAREYRIPIAAWYEAA